MLKLKVGVFATFIAVLALTGSAFGDDVPAWLQQAASSHVGAYDKDVPAVVLRHESQVTVGEDGKIVTVENYAVKILTRDGRAFARAHAFYLTSSTKVDDIKAWIIRPDGTNKY